jgi:glycosyltransferase involved in cell wall biosynthesis
MRRPAPDPFPLRDILLFSTADFDHPTWTNKQHMAVHFAKRGYRVAYVDSLGLRQPTMSARDLGRIGRRLLRALPLPRQVYRNIWRISPLVLPFHASRLVRAFNARLLYGLISAQLRLLGMRRPLIWTYNPVIADLCAVLPHSGIVYHCVDDLRASPRIDPEIIDAGERRLGEIADLCFATSPALRDRMRKFFSQVVYDPNCCDAAFFETAADPLLEPGELREIPHPRLLFLGALSAYKVDFACIRSLAGRMPEAHWVLVGPIREGEPASELPPVLPNVHVLGLRDYGRLPYFMAHADIAVMPVPRNDYTTSMFPMKFFEYLAAGLPLVGTRLPALAEFEALYFPVDSEEDFHQTLLDVLNGARKDPALVREACRRHSWEARFARMEVALQRHLHCDAREKAESVSQAEAEPC